LEKSKFQLPKPDAANRKRNQKQIGNKTTATFPVPRSRTSNEKTEWSPQQYLKRNSNRNHHNVLKINRRRSKSKPYRKPKCHSIGRAFDYIQNVTNAKSYFSELFSPTFDDRRRARYKRVIYEYTHAQVLDIPIVLQGYEVGARG